MTLHEAPRLGWASPGSGVCGQHGLCQKAPFPYRFEIEIEPIFGILALYDVREKKKVGAPPFPLPHPAPSLSQSSRLPGGGVPGRRASWRW